MRNSPVADRAPSQHDWRDHAACRDHDVDLFYSTEPEDEQRALAICAECPVQVACLEVAMTQREHFGVWGGTREIQRRRVFRRQSREGWQPAPDMDWQTVVRMHARRRRGAA